MKLFVVRALSLSGYFGLLALMIAWHAWLAPSPYFPVALVLVVTAVPLLLPLRGILHGRPRSYVWASFLSLLYFIHGVGEATVAPEQRGLALLEVFFSLLIIAGGSFYARWSESDPANRSSATL